MATKRRSSTITTELVCDDDGIKAYRSVSTTATEANPVRGHYEDDTYATKKVLADLREEFLQYGSALVE